MGETFNTPDFPSLSYGSIDTLDFPSVSSDSTFHQGFDLDQSPAMPMDDIDQNIISCQDESLQHNIMPQQFVEDKKFLSCEEILKLAGVQYMQAIDNGGFDQAVHIAIATLSREDQEGLELTHLLLSSAVMIGNRQYDQACRLVRQCKNLSSQLGNPIQRLAYYFSDALQERIERDTLGGLNEEPKPILNFAYNVDNDFDKNELYGLVAFYTQVFPCAKVLQFTAVQAIIEAVGDAQKIHVIDLGIRTGSQWTVLIQFLADRRFSSNFPSIQLLTITAVGMNNEDLENSGRRLHEFAKSLSVPFLYKMVKISNMEEIHHGLFHVTSGEAVAVYAPIVLRSLLYEPLLLDKLITGIEKLNPRIMVNEEIEGQHNSPSFLNRFIELVFYNSTFFDSLDVILSDRNDTGRIKWEEVFCGYQIRNMIACEGKDRKVRHVKIDVWRSFFRQAGFKEMSLSYQACYQSRLMLHLFPHGKCYTLEPNGDAIVVGWKGTPLFSLSVWGCMW